MNMTVPNHIVSGAAIAPQALTAGSTINGNRIVTPGTTACKIMFVVTCGTLTGVTVLTIGVQYSQNGGTTWNNFLGADGATPVTFKAANTIAGSRLDSSTTGGGALQGSLDLSRANHGDYRLVVSTLTGGNINIAATYSLIGGETQPMQDAANDDLLSQQLIALQSGGTPYPTYNQY